MTVTVAGLRADRLMDVLALYGLQRALEQTGLPMIRWGGDGLAHLHLPGTGTGDVVDFLLSRWAPTPVVSPWNAGSGFGVGWDARGLKTSTRSFPAWDALEGLTEARFASLSRSIGTCRALAQAAAAQNWTKTHMVLAARAALPDAAVEWVDACVLAVPGPDGELVLRYPMLTGGTGGNIGSADLSSLQARHLVRVLLPGRRQEDLPRRWADALFTGEPVPLVEESAAHLDAGGLVNPWAWVLAMEGICALSVGPALATQAGPHARVPVPGQFREPAPDAPDGEHLGEVWVPLPTAWWTPGDTAHAASWYPRGHRGRVATRPLGAAMALAAGRAAPGVVYGRWRLPLLNGLSPVAVFAGALESAA